MLHDECKICTCFYKSIVMLFTQGTFSSPIAVLLSMLGAVVGTGNIWRFPRIVATHASGGGIELHFNHSVYFLHITLPSRG